MKQLAIKIFLVFNIMFPAYLMSQTIGQIEEDLLVSLKRMDDFSYLSRRTDETAFDSLISENRVLKNKLILYASKNAEMFSHDFLKLKSYGFYKACSPDKNFCIYSWDSQTGGSMHFYENIVQYQQNGKIYVKIIEKEEGTPGGFYSNIYQSADGPNTFYICYHHRILSDRDGYQALHIFDFENEKFDFNLKKIKTKSGLTNSLGFSFNFYTVMDRKERPVKLIEYDSIQQIISIPVVDTNGKVTPKHILYKYDGNYFIRDTAKK